MIKTLKIFPLLFTIALAQKNISGTISDDNSGEPLIGANVIISSDDFNTGAATDQNGYFTINSVPNGDYDIRVSYIVMVIIKIKYQLPTILHLMNFN